MKTMRTILIIFTCSLILLGLLLFLGLVTQPKSFPRYSEKNQQLSTIPLPAGLPAPVERFYRTVFGENIPVITNVVLQGRATMKPFLNIPIPARFVFVHNAGKDYRHYFEATLFGLPIMKINEGYIDGKSFFEGPMGSYSNDPNSNQGANLTLWAEATWFPAIWITDARVRWEAIDEYTAILFVPFEKAEENFIVRFNPQTGLIDTMETMRYRESGEDKTKILWIARNEAGQPVAGTNINAVGSVMWLDQGTPWAIFNVEELVYNVDVSTYILQKGQ